MQNLPPTLLSKKDKPLFRIRLRPQQFFYRGTWLGLLTLLLFCYWAGSEKTLAQAAATSNTSTITVTATVTPAIALYVSATTVDLGSVTSGTDVYNTANLTVASNCQDGYKLYAFYTKNLQHDTVTSQYIAPTNLGSAAGPSPYTGTGLGFSLSGAAADLVQAKWNAAAGSVSANYSSFTSGTSGIEVNNYANYSSGNTIITVLFRLDVTASQYSGPYTTETKWYAVTNS